MSSPQSCAPSISDAVILEHVIRHDIEDITDLDEFLTADDVEDEVMAMVSNAGHLY